MRRIIFVILLFTLAPAAAQLSRASAQVAPSAQLPKDVTGWGKIKWGITVAQAKALLGDTVIPENAPEPNNPYPTKLRLQDVQIGLEHGTVAIQTQQNSDVVCVVTLLASTPAEETSPGRRAEGI